MSQEPRRHEVVPLFVRWTAFVKWLLPTTEKFPKKVRFTFTSRIDNLALDVLESIIAAVYTKRPSGTLREINLKIDKLRVLLRICQELTHMPTQSYKHAVRQLYECGQMAGGWGKQAAG